tara:strand:- start:368 stop:574 length:207 start_codon:yes stop_codon:yes gene_type:complete
MAENMGTEVPSALEVVKLSLSFVRVRSTEVLSAILGSSSLMLSDFNLRLPLLKGWMALGIDGSAAVDM